MRQGKKTEKLTEVSEMNGTDSWAHIKDIKMIGNNIQFKKMQVQFLFLFLS